MQAENELETPEPERLLWVVRRIYVTGTGFEWEVAFVVIERETEKMYYLKWKCPAFACSTRVSKGQYSETRKDAIDRERSNLRRRVDEAARNLSEAQAKADQLSVQFPENENPEGSAE